MLNGLSGWLLLLALGWAGFGAIRITNVLAGRQFIAQNWEVRVLASAVIMGFTLVAVVEVASSLNAIAPLGLAIGWLLAGTGLHCLSAKEYRRLKRLMPEDSALLLPPSSSRREFQILLGVSTILLGTLFLQAVLTPPTSWDSLTYHLPRVLNWIQNHSVSPFATHDTRQIESGPLAAYAVMHLYLLTGTDRLVNLVQWAAMVLSGVGVSWLAVQIVEPTIRSSKSGSVRAINNRIRLWTAFYAITMPIGIVQSITTQTDYVVALWVVCAAVFGLLFWRNRASSVSALLFGSSIALGVLTKATMVITVGVVAVFLLALGLRAAASNKIRIRSLLWIVLTFCVILAPQFVRNVRVFGSPLGSRYIYALMRNEHQAPSIWISNVIRNLSLHAASGIPQITKAANNILKAAHLFSGRSDNDRETTFFTSTFSYRSGYPISDNSAGNFWHGLIALFTIAYLVNRSPSLRLPVLSIAGTVLITFILQSGYLRWTEWNARFHLPLFLILAPVVGIGLAEVPRSGRTVLGIVITLVGFHAMLFNKSRPILGQTEFIFQDRERQYFIEVPNLYRPSLNAVTDVIASGSTNVGMRLYKDFFRYLDEMEYPFWVMLRNRGFNGKLYNVGVTNETARFSNSVPIQALISSARGPQSEVVNALPYRLQYPPIDVYFSESYSHWAQMTQVAADGTQHLLGPNPDTLKLEGNAGLITCRVARQGILRAELVLMKQASVLPTPTTLLIRTFAGNSFRSDAENGRHFLEIPLPPGQTAIQFAVLGRKYQEAALSIKWTWYTVETPLPYVFISRIFDPTSVSGVSTNALTLISGSLRRIEMVAGSKGEVGLRLLGHSAGSAELLIEGKGFSSCVRQVQQNG